MLLECRFTRRKQRVENRPQERRCAWRSANRAHILSTFSSLLLYRGSAAMARGGVEPPLPPYQSDMLPLQHRAANRGGGNRTRCDVRPRPPLIAAVPGGPPLPFTPKRREA